MLEVLIRKSPGRFEAISAEDQEFLVKNEYTEQAWMAVGYLIDPPREEEYQEVWRESIATLLAELSDPASDLTQLSENELNLAFFNCLHFITHQDKHATQEMNPVRLEQIEQEEENSEELDDTIGEVTDEEYLQELSDLQTWQDIFGAELPERSDLREQFINKFKDVLNEVSTIFYPDELEKIKNKPGDEPFFTVIELLAEYPVREVLDELVNPDITIPLEVSNFTTLLMLYGYKTSQPHPVSVEYLNKVYNVANKLVDFFRTNPDIRLLDWTLPQFAKDIYQSQLSEKKHQD